MASTTVGNDLSRDFRRSLDLAAQGIAWAASANIISRTSKWELYTPRPNCDAILTKLNRRRDNENGEVTSWRHRRDALVMSDSIAGIVEYWKTRRFVS